MISNRSQNQPILFSQPEYALLTYIKKNKPDEIPKEYHGIYDGLNRQGIVRNCSLTPRGKMMLNMEERQRSPVKRFLYFALMPFI